MSNQVFDEKNIYNSKRKNHQQHFIDNKNVKVSLNNILKNFHHRYDGC